MGGQDERYGGVSSRSSEGRTSYSLEHAFWIHQNLTKIHVKAHDEGG